MLRYIAPGGGGSDPTPKLRSPKAPQFNRLERRELFREMALAELRYGDDHDWRRKRLVQFAAKMQLTAVEAGRLMQEAQRELELAAKTATGGWLAAPSLDASHLKYVPAAVGPTFRPSEFIWAGLIMLASGIAVGWLN